MFLFHRKKKYLTEMSRINENMNKNDNYYYEINNIEDINFITNKNNFNNLYIYIKNIDYLTFLYNNNIKNIIVDEELIENKEIQFLYFLNKYLTIKINNNIDNFTINKYLNNPLIENILYEKNNNIDFLNFLSENNNIENFNDTINININKILSYNNLKFTKEIILSIINKVWGYFSSYYIYNLPQYLENEEIKNIYDYISSNLGKIVKCRPVNDNSENISYSRDVKFTPNSNHYFSSNKYQPLHSDFAYFTYKKSPDYLTLYCLEKSEYGGITSLLTTKTLKNILEKYNKQLLEKICIDFTYKSQVDENNNFEIHNKKCFDLDTNYINWNYFQIKEEYNDKEKMKIRQEFFDFLNNFIYQGRMMDLNIIWEKGDCILFSDHLNLHTRSAFLGERWLSGNAFFKK